MPTTTHAAGNGVHVPTLNFVRSLLDVFAGPNHGLRVAVHGAGSPVEHIEVVGGGRLPKRLRAGLLRARAYWEQRGRSGSVSWDAATIVWHTTDDGWGPRFAIPNIGVLLELVVECRLLKGTRA